MPLNVDVGEEAAPKDPPEPLTIDHVPVPIDGVLAAKVTVVNPHVKISV